MRWLNSITNSMDMNLSKFQEIIQDRGAWCTTVHRITKSLSDLATEQQMLEFIHVSTYLFTKHSLTIIPLLGTVLDMKMQQWKTHTQLVPQNFPAHLLWS